MRLQISTILFIIFLAAAVSAQVKQTENTIKLSDGGRPEKASIADMEWLSGSWTGTGLGGLSEEVWSKPQGGIMMGMYRMLDDGKPMFYELLTLGEADGSLIIRLKHFDPNFVGWEEKDKTVDFRFVKKDAKRFYFEGMTFEPVGNKELNIYLAIKNRDGKVREEIFRYTRVQ